MENTSQTISLDWASPEIRRILGRALDGAELAPAEGIRLALAQGRDVHALTLAADEMRRRQAGDVVSYVVNRNINFTNVCIKHCTFCAFSRDHREEEGYFLPMDEVVRRAIEAWELGATEVCIQAGLPPKLEGSYYIDLCRAIKAAVPEMHLHAFSPEEILYGSTRSGMAIADYLAELRQAGLGTLPGTSAEILDQDIRDLIARGRITVAQWIEVITTAHRLGIRTTATIMYGHVERPEHWIRHMELLRGIQRETGGFTEFVPLSLIHQEAPMYRRGLVPGVRAGATGVEVVKMHAIARLYLGPTFRNIQASWVKEGPKLAQHLLACGANDLGGTLINESISTSAGASYGQLVPPAELRRLIREAGRVPAQRSTVYDRLRMYEREEEDDDSPLDHVSDAEARFGSYRQLAASGKFRYLHPLRPAER
ncbi:MAG TPA: 5-amino-6-(D-ribitylamino)uracil--L-tyrosine 4-hydroxyphenyl transferase CofH [Methylomirabilota bacterium]|nr:5-amino-6-(D-ribitylamino)uracil--L-tyrosine 4-hydroxyphenyl transferase CofH [Methylomirabilota bacterium]